MLVLLYRQYSCTTRQQGQQPFPSFNHVATIQPSGINLIFQLLVQTTHTQCTQRSRLSVACWCCCTADAAAHCVQAPHLCQHECCHDMLDHRQPAAALGICSMHSSEGHSMHRTA